MPVPAQGLPTPPLIVVAAYVQVEAGAPSDYWLCQPNGSISLQRSDWVPETQGHRMVDLQAKGAPRNRPGLSREGLIVKAQVRDRPVQVLPGEGLPPVLPVVSHPLLVLIISLGMHN